MAKGDKYIALTMYLEKCGKDKVVMNFKEIESVIGTKLSNSAYKYAEFWSNTKSHSSAFGWMNAGYRSQNVNLTNQTIEFVKEHKV